MANSNATKVLASFERASARVTEVAQANGGLGPGGAGLLAALAETVRAAVADTEKHLASMDSREAARLDELLATFHVQENLDHAIRLSGISWKMIIEILKQAIGAAKHLLPVPKKWKDIIDSILVLIDLLL